MSSLRLIPESGQNAAVHSSCTRTTKEAPTFFVVFTRQMWVVPILKTPKMHVGLPFDVPFCTPSMKPTPKSQPRLKRDLAGPLKTIFKMLVALGLRKGYKEVGIRQRDLHPARRGVSWFPPKLKRTGSQAYICQALKAGDWGIESGVGNGSKLSRAGVQVLGFGCHFRVPFWVPVSHGRGRAPQLCL